MDYKGVTVTETVPAGTEFVSATGDAKMFENMTYIFPVLAYAVAALIVMTTLSRMIDNQRMQMGTLKALGMRTSSIRRIFLYRSALLFARGAAWGNAVGLLLVGVQALWEIVRLDPSGYMLSTLPVSIGWWIVWLNVGVMAVAVGVMVLPSMAVARIAPEESLKYKL